MLLFVMMFMFISMAVSFSIARTVYSGLMSHRLLNESKQAHFAAESMTEDVAYRRIVDLTVDDVESNTLFGVDVIATTTEDLVSFLWTIDAEADRNNVERQSQIVLAIGDGSSFNFGLQSGTGGITLENNTEIVGNVFSNGAVVGDKTGGGAYVKGDVISAGPSGWVEEVHATGSVWSNTIHDIEVDVDAYYDTEDAASVVTGTRYTPWPDQATATFPISDETIQSWEDNITASGTIYSATSTECSGGTFTVSSDTSLGDVRIDCDFEIDTPNVTLTLTGPVWVQGDIRLAKSTIRASSSVGARSVQMIADNNSNRSTSSRVVLNNTVEFYGSGEPKSYVLLLSMNDDAENSLPEIAIDLNQKALYDVLVYAPHGLIEIGGNFSIKEVTAYQMLIKNGGSVIYESGLVNMLFTSGPGGGFTLYDWSEI